MKILVIGGTGLIGSRAIQRLIEHGHKAISASPSSGVNTLTGEGVADAMAGVDVVIDVSNSPSFADDDVMNFFVTSTTNLLAAEKDAGVKHHVALSVVGTDRVPESGYLRAKVAQEKLITESGIPYSLVHATQFFEFVKGIADSATEGDTVRLSHASIQPIAADDVAAVVARTAAGAPLNGTLEIGGPEKFGMDELIATGLAAFGDPRTVVTDATAPYFGAVLTGDELIPGPDAELSTTTFSEWLARS
ncbi:uncharacterized protein YbjT (DUF2867 family) [Leifsonia sp. AK011]|uniref:SDR family oxidoreductase n=1 Tax=Leifsonia sp. AK011 TaxID=2723075 RepID=UPI0015CAD740|nr:SDR family oxidoreductase [Leifsonia sp. AK011]NYF09782.1 uncharacterized protein YbjT (DUF2867 family) [Leifsonia sp. AK011]